MASNSGGKMTYVFLARQGCVTKPLMLLLLLLAFLLHSANGQVCGGTFFDQSGTVSSPGYDSGTYAGPATCSYYFSNIGGDYAVTLTFTAFNLPSSTKPTCDSDYVQIWTKNVLGTSSVRYCGTDLAAGTTIHNVDPTYGLTFVSSHSDTTNGYGFSADFAYEFTTATALWWWSRRPTRCWWRWLQTASSHTPITTLTLWPSTAPQNLVPHLSYEPSGVFGLSNPYGGMKYARNGNCMWVITAPTGSLVQVAVDSLYFSSFASYNGQQPQLPCQYSSLSVYDGSVVTESARIGRVCPNNGLNGQQLFTSTTNTLTVVLTLADRSGFSSVSFQAEYNTFDASQRCSEGNITGSSGELTGPGYPGAYPNNTFCLWTIQVPEGSVVRVSWINITINRVSYDMWEGAVVSVYDGPSTGFPFLGSYCTSADQTSEVTSSNNTLTLTFQSWHNYFQWKAFSLSFTAIQPVPEFRACGGNLTVSGGELTSPMYPSHYPNNSRCVWLLHADPGDRVRLTFNSFDLEPSNACQNDFLEMLDGNFEWSVPLGRVCGDSVPFDTTSDGDVMRVEFGSDMAESHTGFHATWTSVCERDLNAGLSSNTFQSPNYPYTYVGKKECTYVLSVWEQYLVKLEFDAFNLGNGDNCNGTYIEIRDGGFSGAPLLGKRYCGSALPPVWTGSSNQLFVRYVTDGLSDNTLFRATFTAVEPTCGSKSLTGDRGTVTTPLYPSNYPNHIECSWDIVAPATNDVIQLTFDTFQLEEWWGWCPWDWVKVYDGDKELGPFCGSRLPDTITSSGSTLRVVFSSDWSVTMQGFSASYLAYNPYSAPIMVEVDDSENTPFYNGPTKNSRVWGMQIQPKYTRINRKRSMRSEQKLIAHKDP